MSDSKLYYTIGEVSRLLGVNASKLRFWERQFPSLKPTKNQRGSRFYTRQDVELLRRILYLTDQCGYTLEGARDQLKSDRVEDPRLEVIRNLTQVREFLVRLKEEL